MKEAELIYRATATNLPQVGNFKDLSNDKVAKKFRESNYSGLFFIFQFREYKAIKQDLNGTKLYDLNNKPILCPGRSHSYYLAFEVYENAHIAGFEYDSNIFRPLILKFWAHQIEDTKSSERLESINEKLKLIKERVLKDKKI